MSSKWSFYVAYSDNKELQNVLNALKIVADINQRTEAHITVRGPYKKRLSNDKKIEFSKIISGEKLIISAVDNFFPHGQNTVYFKCDYNDKLKKVWNKFTYTQFIPHITIYDGNNRVYANKLYKALKENFKPFNYKVKKLSLLESNSSDELDLYHLKNSFNYNFFYKVLGEKLTKESISTLSENQKIRYIERMSEYLYSEFNHPSGLSLN